MSATEDKRLHERVANMEAQLKEGLENMKVQLDRLEQSSKNSTAQLSQEVSKIFFANFAQLLQHGATMFVSHTHTHTHTHIGENTGKHNKKV